MRRGFARMAGRAPGRLWDCRSVGGRIGCGWGWVGGGGRVGRFVAALALALAASESSRARAQSRPAQGTARDWEIARAQVEWAIGHRLAANPSFGDLIGAIGERLVGTAYEPHTLELPGPERLVINLEALDCVTFVENVLVMTRLAWTADPALVGGADSVHGPDSIVGRDPVTGPDPDAFQAAYRRELAAIRYRGGVLDGYASRLHYFSEWIDDNAARGNVAPVSRELGGIPDSSPIDFMSTHPDAYRQLADPAARTQIAAIEARLNASPRFYLPEAAIEAAAPQIREGDIIAATSTVDGLDIAHTGIAVWRGGVLRLMHAPLVGSNVQISPESLAERIVRTRGQDGIMVARPVAPERSADSPADDSPSHADVPPRSLAADRSSPPTPR